MKVKCICKQCGKEFETEKCYIKRGGGKFCSVSCGTTYRNIHDNPTKKEEVRKKISENHSDVSGENNPMYGVRGEKAPAYIDGRSNFKGETYRKILLATGREPICKICGSKEKLHVHHIDGNHKNNDIDNLVWLCSDCHMNKAHQYKRDEKGKFTSSELNKQEAFFQ